MSNVERMTITVPHDLAATVRGAVDGGDYASTSEVVRDALRDWKLKQQMREREIEALRDLLAPGLASFEAGNTSELDIEDIKKRGRERLARQSEN